MLMFDCWGVEERGGDADICKYTRIRNTFNPFRNKNQGSMELTEFVMHFFCKNKIFKNIEGQSLRNNASPYFSL